MVSMIILIYTNILRFLNWIFLDHITVMTLHCCRLFTPSFRRNVPQWELHHCWSSVCHYAEVRSQSLNIKETCIEIYNY